MSDRLVEGLWDCRYCNTKKIGGRIVRCPNCGRPQSSDTKFYLGKKKTYLEKKEEADYRQGPDWTCSFCGSLNLPKYEKCQNCGADRKDSCGTYFDNFRKTENRSSDPFHEYRKRPEDSVNSNSQSFSEEIPSVTDAEALNHKETWKDKISGFFQRNVKAIIGITAVIVIGIIAAMLLTPNTYDATVIGKSWTREITVEEYKTVRESDWSVPSGGRTVYTKREVHHYVQVLDHYESVSVQKSRTVQNGYDIRYTDNGNGTFTEHSSPRYVTEYYTEYEQRPVYRNKPVYQTKYYYDIERWVYSRNVCTEGTDDEPYWGDLILEDNEREGKSYETYTLQFTVTDHRKEKDYSKNIDQTIWAEYDVGETVPITVQAGMVTKINDQKEEM